MRRGCLITTSRFASDFRRSAINIANTLQHVLIVIARSYGSIGIYCVGRPASDLEASR